MNSTFVSPYETVGGLVWFARMLGKIRLRAEGKLPEEYHTYMGLGFDRQCVHFLKIDYDELVERVLAGGSDEAVLEWCFSRGYRPSANELLVWNEFMIKRGWRDTDAPADEFQEYKKKYGLGGRDDILTYFDFYEVDEGRKP